MKKFLCASDVARLLHVDRATVTRWIRRGLIPGVQRLPGTQQWRIPLASYEKLAQPYESSKL
jgi:excisionase family DNA binding protein